MHYSVITSFWFFFFWVSTNSFFKPREKIQVIGRHCLFCNWTPRPKKKKPVIKDIWHLFRHLSEPQCLYWLWEGLKAADWLEEVNHWQFAWKNAALMLQSRSSSFHRLMATFHLRTRPPPFTRRTRWKIHFYRFGRVTEFRQTFTINVHRRTININSYSTAFKKQTNKKTNFEIQISSCCILTGEMCDRLVAENSVCQMLLICSFLPSHPSRRQIQPRLFWCTAGYEP